jgi:hypothetical protein
LLNVVLLITGYFYGASVCTILVLGLQKGTFAFDVCKFRCRPVLLYQFIGFVCAVKYGLILRPDCKYLPFKHHRNLNIQENKPFPYYGFETELKFIDAM